MVTLYVNHQEIKLKNYMKLRRDYMKYLFAISTVIILIGAVYGYIIIILRKFSKHICHF